MLYRDFRRLNPQWPKLLRDVEGRLVRLNFCMETKGGSAFAKKTVMRVHHYHRGKLILKRLSSAVPMKDQIRGVAPMHVELLPAWFKPCLLCEGIGDVHGFKPSKPNETWIETCPRCQGSGEGRRKADLAVSKK